jgi:hypothetical protein
MIVNTDRQLFQYRNSTRLNTLLDEFYDLAKSVAPANLEQFYNVELASGVWLTQLADIFNVKRNYFTGGSGELPFVLDLSDLDSTDILDGRKSPMDDFLLRALLKARILRNSVSTKSIDYIYRVFFIIFGEDLDIQIQQTAPKTLTITIDFNGDSIGFRNLQAMVAKDIGWFGSPTGVEIIYDYVIGE